jgi:quinol monooxygenase YgiN
LPQWRTSGAAAAGTTIVARMRASTTVRMARTVQCGLMLVIARWVARDGEVAAVEAALAGLVPAARAEPGVLAFDVYRDPADARIFVLVERFRDRAAHDAHIAAEHTRRHAIEDALPRLDHRERTVLEPMAGISD